MLVVTCGRCSDGVLPSPLLSGCRYLINFLLDATLGMLVIYTGVRVVSWLVEWQQWDSLRFGEYGKNHTSRDPAGLTQL